MILGDLNATERIANLSNEIAEALKWISSHRKDEFKPGKIEIIPNKIYVNCEEVAMIPREKQMLEAHRRYIDIHIPISETEIIGWAHIDNLKNVLHPYDDERDIEFYGDKPQVHLPVYPGQYAIFFPEDAHAPNIGIGNHRKFCIKIAID